MKEITFNKFNNNRKQFLTSNKNADHIVKEGTNNILISAPHGVPQVRLGKYKCHELGSVATALHLKTCCDNCYFIAKTKCNNDDANFDEVSPYKNTIRKLIKEKNIKFVIDFHGLASHRECDVNLGVHFGENIKNDVATFDLLNNMLVSGGFVVSIDQPFMAGTRTICGSLIDEFEDIWVLQIEINCGITNNPKNFEKNKKLLSVFESWINQIK